MAVINKKYFDEAYFGRILSLVADNRFDEALCEFKKYLIQYPNDFCAYIYYAGANIKMGNFSEAEKILANVKANKNTSDASKDEYLLAKIKLLTCQGKYNEAYNLLINNIEVFCRNGWSYKGLLIYLRNKLKILMEKDYKAAEEKYLLSQLINYSESAAISHIEKHMPFDEEEISPVLFNADFPMEEIYYKLRQMLPNDKCIYHSIFDSMYIIKYDNNGHVNSRLVDYFAVITVINTNDIITMYPFDNKSGSYALDLTPTIDISKVKRISQIDKFNQRYGKNS